MVTNIPAPHPPGSPGWIWLADLVAWIHLGWVLFLVFGAALGCRHTWVRRLHLAGLGFAAWIVAGNRVCPLTHLEAWLREQGDAPGPSGTFLGRLAEAVVYAELPRVWVAAGFLAVAGASLGVYGWTWYRRPR
ncbi:DUF2784 domain-containing protein [Deferrisoma palaeochoriense]